MPDARPGRNQGTTYYHSRMAGKPLIPERFLSSGRIRYLTRWDVATSLRGDMLCRGLVCPHMCQDCRRGQGVRQRTAISKRSSGWCTTVTTPVDRKREGEPAACTGSDGNRPEWAQSLGLPALFCYTTPCKRGWSPGSVLVCTKDDSANERLMRCDSRTSTKVEDPPRSRAREKELECAFQPAGRQKTGAPSR